MGTPTPSVHKPHQPDPHSLGPLLEPHLSKACSGHLGPVEWFRSMWQHGGASTGFADWTDDAGRATPVMVKLPVGSVEYRWTTALGSADSEPEPPTPRVLAHGQSLNGYDLAWLIVERLEGHLL